MRTTILLLAALAAAGCQNTGAESDPLISNELVARGLQVSALTTLVGTELSLVASAPPTGFTTCPIVSQEGDVWTFDYGAEGCVPDSGITADTVLGLFELTVAAGSGAFFGTATDVGVTGSTLSASVSGSTSTAGDLITADVDLGTATWLRDQVEFSFTSFLEIAGDADTVSIFVDSGQLEVPEGEPVFIEVEDAVTPRAGLGGCFVPAGGSIELLRELGRTDLDFSEETHSSSSVTATHNDRDPAAVSPCS